MWNIVKTPTKNPQFQNLLLTLLLHEHDQHPNLQANQFKKPIRTLMSQASDKVKKSMKLAREKKENKIQDQLEALMNNIKSLIE